MLPIKITDPLLGKWKVILGEFVERYIGAIHASSSDEDVIQAEMSFLEQVLKEVCAFLALRDSDYWQPHADELYHMISQSLDFIDLQMNFIGTHRVSRWADLGEDIREYLDLAIENIDQKEFDEELMSDNPAELTYIDLFGANDRF